MKRRILLIAGALIPMALSGIASAGTIDNSKIGKLGMSPEQAAKFVPEVTDYVSSAANPEVGMLPANSVK